MVVLEVVETAAPGGRFTLLSLAERRALVTAQTTFASDRRELGSVELFHGTADAAAAQIREAALLGPRGIAQLAAPPEEDGPLVLAPTPLTGYVPDFDQEFLLGDEPPIGSPTAQPPLSEQQQRLLTIRTGIGLASERLSPQPEKIEDLGASE